MGWTWALTIFKPSQGKLGLSFSKKLDGLTLDHLKSFLLQRFIETGASALGKYGLDAANMSSLTCAGMTADLVFVCGVIIAVLKIFMFCITYVSPYRISHQFDAHYRRSDIYDHTIVP